MKLKQLCHSNWMRIRDMQIDRYIIWPIFLEIKFVTHAKMTQETHSETQWLDVDQQLIIQVHESAHLSKQHKTRYKKDYEIISNIGCKEKVSNFFFKSLIMEGVRRLKCLPFWQQWWVCSIEKRKDRIRGKGMDLKWKSSLLATASCFATLLLVLCCSASPLFL